MRLWNKKREPALTIKEITAIGMMAAVIEVSKAALSFLPNIELVTFWIILFTLYFGRKAVYAIAVFLLIEGALYGFGIWWVAYAYVWPLIAFCARRFKSNDNRFFWAIYAGICGLLFGALCSLAYIGIGMAGGSLANGLSMALEWWIAGIPWDLAHGASNFVLMAVLYEPVRRTMRKAGLFQEYITKK